MALGKHNDKPATGKRLAAQKFEAVEIDIPNQLASRDEWLRHAEEVYPIVQLALANCTRDDNGVTDACAKAPEAMLKALEATQDALAKYQQLVELLDTGQARLLVGLERAAREAT
jgi:hypothetical protein